MAIFYVMRAKKQWARIVSRRIETRIPEGGDGGLAVFRTKQALAVCSSLHLPSWALVSYSPGELDLSKRPLPSLHSVASVKLHMLHVSTLSYRIKHVKKPLLASNTAITSWRAGSSYEKLWWPRGSYWGYTGDNWAALRARTHRHLSWSVSTASASNLCSGFSCDLMIDTAGSQL